MARQLITPPFPIRHTPEPTWRWGIAPTDDPDHERAGYTGFKPSFGGQVKEYAGTWGLPIHAVKYSLFRAAKTFSNTYISVARSSHY